MNRSLDRERYMALNTSFSTRFVFQYGTGSGFGAETIGLIRRVVQCLANDVQFVFGAQEPKGFAVENGWEDYFEPLWPHDNCRQLSLLNRTVFPLGRYPLFKTLSGIVLRCLDGKYLYMFDDIGTYSRERLEAKGLTGDYWAQIRQLCDLIWVYRPSVRQAIDEQFDRLQLTGSFIAVHVRRGDKNTESPYLPLENYMPVLGGLDASLPIYVATDDQRIVPEFAQRLPGRRLLSAGDLARVGYDQRHFNKAEPRFRYDETLFFLFELELMLRSVLFVGASPSNVYYLTRYRRGNEGLVDVGVDAVT
jgi:hypothetical protein